MKSIFFVLNVAIFSLGVVVISEATFFQHPAQSIMELNKSQFFSIKKHLQVTQGLLMMLDGLSFGLNPAFMGGVTAISLWTEISFKAHLTNTEVEWAVMDAVKHRYSVDEKVTPMLDEIQRSLKCCGAKDPTSWVFSAFGKNDTTKTRSPLVPDSCCWTYKTRVDGKMGDNTSARELPVTQCYNVGCSQAVVNLFHTHYYNLGMACLVYVVLRLLSFIIRYLISYKTDGKLVFIPSVDKYKQLMPWAARVVLPVKETSV